MNIGKTIRMGVFILLSVMMLFALVNVGKSSDFSELEESYLGQKLPGLSPEIFAPGIVSTEKFEFGVTMSPDGTEFFFTRRQDYQGSSNRIYCTRFIDGKWTKPELASFAKDIFEFLPVIAPDGERLFFYSDRVKPFVDQTAPSAEVDGNLWYSVKEGNAWSQARYFECPINRSYNMMVSVAENGTIYYAGTHNQKRGIYRSELRDGEYTEPVYLPDQVNIPGAAHPFIAPDESYIIFDAQLTGRGKPELFISFHEPSDTWTEAINMGPTINTSKTEFAAFVSPDKRFLFFHRRVEGNGDIYWVDAKVIERLRPFRKFEQQNAPDTNLQ